MENERGLVYIPRMRTAPKIVSAIKALDPESDITENCVRQLVKDGAVKVVWAGSKALINLDDVLEVMRTGTVRQEPEPETVGGIRKVDVRVPKLKRGATYI